MRLLIIGASSYQHYLYEAALNNGIEVYAVDRDPDAPMFKKAMGFKPIDIFDIDGVVEYAKEIKVDAVTTINIDQGMLAVSEIQRRLGFPYKSADLIKRCIRKDLMRDQWELDKVNNPVYMVFTEQDINKAIEYIKNADFSVIVKPVDNAAKRGVHRVSPTDSDILERIKDAYKNSKLGRIIIEEYIDGELYFVPTYIKSDNEIITSLIKQKYNKNHVQIQYDAPVEIERSAKEEIVKQAIRAVKKFGKGPYHTEVIYSKKRGAVLVETSPRISYATVSLTKLVEGFDPVAQLLNDCNDNLNINAFSEASKDYRSARLTHIQPNPGLVYNGEMDEYTDVSRGIYEVKSVVKKGHVVNDFRTNSDRVMYFICYSNSNGDLHRISQEFEAELINKCFSQ